MFITRQNNGVPSTISLISSLEQWLGMCFLISYLTLTDHNCFLAFHKKFCDPIKFALWNSLRLAYHVLIKIETGSTIEMIWLVIDVKHGLWCPVGTTPNPWIITVICQGWYEATTEMPSIWENAWGGEIVFLIISMISKMVIKCALFCFRLSTCLSIYRFQSGNWLYWQSVNEKDIQVVDSSYREPLNI